MSGVIRILSLTTVLASVILASTASAQPANGVGSGRQRPRSVDVEVVVRPRYIPSDLDIVREVVSLDDGQAIVIETLFADFDEAFAEGVQKLRVDLQQSQPGNLSGGTLEGARNAQARYDQQMRALQQALSQSLRAAETSEERERLRNDFTKAVERLTNEQAAVESRAGDSVGWESFLVLQSELMQAWVEERNALEADLLLGIELVLEPQQLEAWVQAQQAIHRRGMTSENALGGEGLDLDARVRRLGLDESSMEMMEPSLRAYAESIDEAVTARFVFLIEAVPATSAVLASSDWSQMKAIIAREAELRALVRDLNLQWLGLILDVMPEPQRTTLRDDVRRYAFGTVWDDGRADRIFSAALQRDDLTDSERSRLEQMRAECAVSREPLQLRQQAIVVQEAAGKWRLDQERRWASSFTGGVSEGPSQRSESSSAVRTEMAQVEAECSESIKTLLGDERYLQLPGTQTRPRRSGEGRRDDRSEESIRRRDELYKRFDSNGDGRLDADERRRMRDTLQNEQRRP